MSEIFKDVHGYCGLYTVSNKGRVTSSKRGVLLKPDVATGTATSYARVTLSSNNTTARFLIHRLVAQEFIPNPLNKPHVNHIDNNGLNNTVENLEWCTRSENMQHSVKQGRQDIVQVRATQAAIIPNYARYIKAWQKKLQERFLAFYTPGEVKHSGTKQIAAVAYLCKECRTARLSLTSWVELSKHNGICPNCSLSLTLLDPEA